MTSVNYCRLCTSETESFIDMSGDQGIRLNIEEIIGEHFCLKVIILFYQYIRLGVVHILCNALASGGTVKNYFFVSKW